MDPATSPNERVLALDVGDRRIGLALSDPLGITAQPLFTLHRKTLHLDLKSIARVVRKYLVTDVVIGLPLHLSGQPSPQAAKTQAFASQLREHLPDLRFHLLDERLTTAEAHTLLDQNRRRGNLTSHQAKRDRQARTSIIDQVAAVLLLESWLSLRSPHLLPPPPEPG